MAPFIGMLTVSCVAGLLQAPLGDKNGVLITESFGKASILQQTFANNFTSDNGILPKVTNRMQSF
jgi:hypothetical protein